MPSRGARFQREKPRQTPIVADRSNPGVCLEYGFDRLNLPSIAAIADPENRASLRVMEKRGFRFVREDRFYHMEVLSPDRAARLGRGKKLGVALTRR